MGPGGTHLWSQLLRRMRQEDHKCKHGLDNLVALVSKKKEEEDEGEEKREIWGGG